MFSWRTTVICTVTVRLAGSYNPRIGRLEVLYRGVWGTVCDDGFDDYDAKVACYMLGFGYGFALNLRINLFDIQFAES